MQGTHCVYNSTATGAATGSMGFFTCCLICAFICCCGCCFAGARYRDQWQGNQPQPDDYRQPDPYELQERRDSHGNVITGQGPPHYLNGLEDYHDHDHGHDNCRDHQGQRQESYPYGHPTPINPPGYAPIIHGGFPHNNPYPQDDPYAYQLGGPQTYGAPPNQFQYPQHPNLYGGAPEQLPPDFFKPNNANLNATAATNTPAPEVVDRGVNYPSKVESKWSSALDAVKANKDLRSEGKLEESTVINTTPKIKP